MPPLPPAPAPAPVQPPLLLPIGGGREDAEADDLLRLDQVTGRVEVDMPRCGREPSFMTESVRRQISFLFDEPSPKPQRRDPLLSLDPLSIAGAEGWGVNWAGNSRAATAA